jgi:tol-pal system protein YbgF
MMVQALTRRIIPALVVAGLGWTWVAAPAAAQDPGAMTLILNRLNDLEAQMLSLTNRVEQLDYQVRELNSRVDLLARDVDFRFSELGGTSTGAASSGTSSSGTLPQLETPILESPTLDSGTLATQGTTTGVTPPAITGGSADGTGGVAAAGTPEAEFQTIRTMLDNREFAAADAALRNFIGQHPNHPLSSSAFFWLGEIYFDRADYQRAAETYAAGFANYPTGYKAADTLLKLGMSLVQLGRPNDACTTFNQLRTAFPNAPINIQQRADQARFSAGCG